MTALERVFAYILSLFGVTPNVSGDASASVSSLDLEPGTLTQEAAANFSDALTWDTWNTYSPDVSSPGGASGGATTGGAQTDWTQRVADFLAGLTATTPAPPVTPAIAGDANAYGAKDPFGGKPDPVVAVSGDANAYGPKDPAGGKPDVWPSAPATPTPTPGGPFTGPVVNQSGLDWGLLNWLDPENSPGNRRTRWLGGNETPASTGQGAILGPSHPSPDLGITPPPPAP